MTGTVLFIILQVLSLGFAVLMLWRLYQYIKRYRFDETKYTLLFGFVHLHWIAIAYLTLVIVWIPVSILYLQLL